MNEPRQGSNDGFQPSDAAREDGHYRLRLFVTGMTPRSTRAVARVKGLCEARLAGRYELTVVDIYQQPALARIDQIIATPTLIKCSPLPVRRLLGDFSDADRVLAGLGLDGSAES